MSGIHMNNGVPTVYAATFYKLNQNFNKKYVDYNEDYVPATHYVGYPFSKIILYIEKVMLGSPYKVLLTEQQRSLFKEFVDDYVEIIDGVSEKLNYNDNLLFQDDIYTKVRDEILSKLQTYKSYTSLVITTHIISKYAFESSYYMHVSFVKLYRDNRKNMKSSPETKSASKLKLLKKLFVENQLTDEPSLEKYEEWLAVQSDEFREYENRYTKMNEYVNYYVNSYDEDDEEDEDKECYPNILQLLKTSFEEHGIDAEPSLEKYNLWIADSMNYIDSINDEDDEDNEEYNDKSNIRKYTMKYVKLMEYEKKYYVSY